ncbi:deoxyhypusine hydroxylase [Tetranychus urticae]|uniref:Deoxyhypusine hydroxylase n=1 Tax=Tetranychus urticae TaxID=32264 RepID=T1JYZ3_TETUR|nr:deoxyhypusine hydroxylase [Tetranychus urticae]
MSPSIDNQLQTAGKILIDSKEPLKKRFRALFTLKNLATPDTIQWINQAMTVDDSVLLQHECGYCLGQMGLVEAVPYLIDILVDTKQNAITRHECGEALGNLACLCEAEMKKKVLNVLQNQLDDESILVSQTCLLSLDKIKWQDNVDEFELKAVRCERFSTHDPAPQFADSKTLEELESILMDKKSSLHNKYRALFSLRNMANSDGVHSLGKTLSYYKNDRNMDLLLHEIGYIFGQLCDPDSIPYLKEIIASKDCHEIARHECTEALGSIGTQDAIDFLEKFLHDDKIVVRQSAEVALDMTDYFSCDQLDV